MTNQNAGCVAPAICGRRFSTSARTRASVEYRKLRVISRAPRAAVNLSGKNAPTKGRAGMARNSLLKSREGRAGARYLSGQWALFIQRVNYAGYCVRCCARFQPGAACNSVKVDLGRPSRGKLNFSMMYTGPAIHPSRAPLQRGSARSPGADFQLLRNWQKLPDRRFFNFENASRQD